jgi:hypothetical protein
MDSHDHRIFSEPLMVYLWYQAINDRVIPALIFKIQYMHFEITQLIQHGN